MEGHWRAIVTKTEDVRYRECKQGHEISRETGPIKEYCFLVTNEAFLEIENCSKNHAYICERSEGKEYILNLL